MSSLQLLAQKEVKIENEDEDDGMVRMAEKMYVN